MDFDDQLLRYFGTHDVGEVSPAALEAGKERMLVDFGLEQDPRNRFAMWAVMHILGVAPDLDVAFKTRDEQEAARNFMDLMARSWDT